DDDGDSGREPADAGRRMVRFRDRAAASRGGSPAPPAGHADRPGRGRQDAVRVGNGGDGGGRVPRRGVDDRVGPGGGGGGGGPRGGGDSVVPAPPRSDRGGRHRRLAPGSTAAAGPRQLRACAVRRG